ncbi:hypothetical protein [Pseudogemmobacter bohemicus]|uniref:hypothetical protein n=1 Tax=Pseudogemmobacter bohemicus TaxID=2250708 RepID=UPI000DD35FCE|nr:hypothetical protein [Pseudogemmobacter bohemicus]
MTETGLIPVLAAPAIDPGNDRIEMSVSVGMTIAEIIELALPGGTPEQRARCRVSLVSERGSSIVLPGHWHHLRPRAGIRVVIRLVPGKNALRAVLSIVVAVAAVAIGAWAAGPAGFGFAAGTPGFALTSSIVGLGVPLIGALLVNPLTASRAS